MDSISVNIEFYRALSNIFRDVSKKLNSSIHK